MSSSDLRGLNKKAQHTALKVVVVAILILILVGVLIYLNVGTGMKAGVGCVAPGVGKGKCVAEQGECIGIINPIAKGCKPPNPHCCIGEVAEGEGVEGPGGEPVTGEESGLKGSVEFYCKCKIEDGYLVADESFQKMSAQSFKAKTGVEYVMQARGTEDIKYCKMNVQDQGKAAGGTCDSGSGPSLRFTFSQGDFKINLYGYDKKDGTKVSSSAVDVTAE